MRIHHRYGIVLAGSALILFTLGCGVDAEQAGNSGAHEGHDHAPGEHTQVAEADIHEGHNHEPGEHGPSQAEWVGDPSTLDWCAEHSVPESECTKCNPSLIAGFKETGDWCAGHDLPESHCRLCNPGIKFQQEEVIRQQTLATAGDDIAVTLFFRPNTPVCATNDALIQFASEETADRAGLSVHQVRTDMHRAAIEAPAEVVFDETQSTVITTTVEALVSRWLVSPGETVADGDVLAILQSPDMAELQARLLSAYAANEAEQKEVVRHQELRARDLISAADLERSEALGEKTRAEYISTRGLLKSAGLAEPDIDEIIEFKKVSNQFALRAPTSGIIVNRIARIGELQEAGQAFALLAEPSAMWIEARLTEEQLRQVAVGQELTFSSDGRGLGKVGARTIWVSRFLDPHTRTGTVRAEVIDPSHMLNAGEFGRVRIVEELNNHVALVPKDAVQWEGCCNVVFVRETADRYRPRKVEFTDGPGSYYQVTSGLDAGEQIVVDGAFLLKTELRKSSIGAGCCGIEPAG